MAKDPAFLFYPNDYIGGTMGMTFEEKGAYMELLMMQFNRGHMTSHMIGQTVGQLWDKISEKFVQDDKGLWYNKRLEEEKEKRKNYTATRKNNLSGVNQYTKKGKKNSGHMYGQLTSHMENENENVDKGLSVKDSFEYFWNHYHTTTGRAKEDKEAAFGYWKKLKLDEQRKAYEMVEKYKRSVRDPQYIKKARTYLRDKNFNDELRSSKKLAI